MQKKFFLRLSEFWKHKKMQNAFLNNKKNALSKWNKLGGTERDLTHFTQYSMASIGQLGLWPIGELLPSPYYNMWTQFFSQLKNNWVETIFSFIIICE